MTIQSLSRAQTAAVQAAFAQLSIVTVDNANYIAVAKLQQLVAGVLYPKGVQEADQYEAVKRAATSVAAEQGYVRAVQLQPPQVAFDKVGQYLGDLPKVDRAWLTEDTLGAAKIHAVRPKHYHQAVAVESALLRKMNATRLGSEVKALLIEQIEAAMQAQGWEKEGRLYTKALSPKLDGLKEYLVNCLGNEKDAVGDDYLFGLATKYVFDQIYRQPREDKNNKYFAPLQPVIRDALIAANFETEVVTRFYNRKLKQFSDEAIERVWSKLAALTPVGTKTGQAIVESDAWDVIRHLAKEENLATNSGLSVRQMNALKRRVLQPWLEARHYKTYAIKVNGYHCKPPRDDGYLSVFPAICNILDVTDHQLQFDPDAPAVYAPCVVVDEAAREIVCLQMVGNRQAVKANWARLMSAYQSPVRLDSTSIRQRGMKKHLVIKRELPLGQAEWVLLHKQASLETVEPDKPFYLLSEDVAKTPSAFFTMLDKVLAIPLQTQWEPYLWRQGVARNLIRPVEAASYGQMAWCVAHSPEAWEKLLIEGFASNELALIQNGEVLALKVPAESTDPLELPAPSEAPEASNQTSNEVPSTEAEATTRADVPSDDIISIYTVDDAVADGVLADMRPPQQDGARPIQIPAITKFPLGRVVATSGALDLAEQGVDLSLPLARHARGDWGDLEQSDKHLNEQALKQGDRIFSSYHCQLLAEADEYGDKRAYTPKLYIITEWNRSVTTIMEASEY